MSDFTAQSIKWHRKNKGMTQAELAAAVGVSLMSIRRYETLGDGNREPSADLFDKIAEQLDTTSDILRGKVVNYDFKDIPQGPVINAEATKAYFTKKNAPTTIAAHFDGDEYTEEELEQIRKFAEFVKSQRKDGDTPELNAAHARTDVDIPEGADTSEDGIMDDKNF